MHRCTQILQQSVTRAKVFVHICDRKGIYCPMCHLKASMPDLVNTPWSPGDSVCQKKKRSFLMSEKGILDHHWRDTAFLMWKSEQIFTFWLRVSVCCNSPPKHKTALLNMRFSWVFQDFQLHLIKKKPKTTKQKRNKHNTTN